MTAGQHARISRLYMDGTTELSVSAQRPEITESIFKALMKLLHQRGFSTELLQSRECQEMILEYAKIFQRAAGPSLTDSVIPPVMRRHLDEDIFLFSGFKTYESLKEAAAMLTDEKGLVKSFNRFYNDITAISKDYNIHWLHAEYIYAQASATMAAKWKQYEEDADQYNLQYRTARDNRVRPEHQILHNITLPFSDPFWNEYFPPNGWRCRCTVVQVRKDKYPLTDSNTAQELGRQATYQPGRNGVNKAAIFRFNPGKKAVIFPPHHPYYRNFDSVGNAKKIFIPDVTNARELTDRIARIGGSSWFVRPLKNIKKETDQNCNGSTDNNGTIWLKSDILNDCINAVNNLKNKEVNNFYQERSMATFWHEITHNRNKLRLSYLTSTQRKYMEMANEFVARNTLPEFFNALGGDLVHKELIMNRDNTGYNDWVVSFQKIINEYKLNQQQVVELVKKHLFEESYQTQKEGLVNALYVASNGLIDRKKAISLVTKCIRGY